MSLVPGSFAISPVSAGAGQRSDRVPSLPVPLVSRGLSLRDADATPHQLNSISVRAIIPTPPESCAGGALYPVIRRWLSTVAPATIPPRETDVRDPAAAAIRPINSTTQCVNSIRCDCVVFDAIMLCPQWSFTPTLYTRARIALNLHFCMVRGEGWLHEAGNTYTHTSLLASTSREKERTQRKKRKRSLKIKTVKQDFLQFIKSELQCCFMYWCVYTVN